MPTQKTVLIVDDEASVTSLYRTILEMEGYSPVIANTGEEGLAYLKREGFPGLILLDCSMPSLGGEQFLDALEDLGSSPFPCPIIGVSSFRKGTPMIRSFEERVTEYVEKPDNIDGFLSLVSRFLGPGKATSEINT